jgi:hypothetical protein
VDVLDLGFGVLTLPAGYRGHLVNELLPAEAHYRAVADDPDLRSRWSCSTTTCFVTG